MADDPRIEKALELIREALLAEYAKGAQDAIARLSALAKAEFGQPDADTEDEEDEADGHPGTPRKRAPRGLVRVLVSRSLAEAAPKGLTTNEFKDKATDEYEEMISLGSIRNELRRGSADGRYREEGGRWFITASGQKQRGHP